MKHAAAAALALAAGLSVASGVAGATSLQAAYCLGFGFAGALFTAVAGTWLVMAQHGSKPPDGDEEGRHMVAALEAIADDDPEAAERAARRLTRGGELHGALRGAMDSWSRRVPAEVLPSLTLVSCEEVTGRRVVALAEDEAWQRISVRARVGPVRTDEFPLCSPGELQDSAKVCLVKARTSSRPGSMTSTTQGDLAAAKRRSVHGSVQSARASDAPSGSPTTRRSRAEEQCGGSGSRSPSRNSSRESVAHMCMVPSLTSDGPVRGRPRDLDARQSFLGRMADSDSSGSSDSSNSDSATCMHVARSVLTTSGPGGRSTTCGPTAGTSGVVTGARRLGMNRRRGSSSSSDDGHTLESVMRTKPAHAELYRIGLKDLPRSLCPALAATLKRLDVSSNSLQAFPDNISDLTQLTDLIASSNQIEILPESLSLMPSLKVLHMQHNRLVALPEVLPVTLEDVNVAWNALTCFPEQTLRCPLLLRMDLSENPGVLELPAASAFASIPDKCTVRMDNEPTLVAAVARMHGSAVKCGFIWNPVFPDKIIPGLYLGPLRSAQDRVYERLHITHVATIGRELDVRPPSHIEHLKISVDDVADEDIRPLLHDAHRFIDSARERGGACFVHCFKGQSRSATVVVSYLMVTERRSLASALATVRQARPMVRPNEGFIMQIARLEETLELDRDRSPSHTLSSARNRLSAAASSTAREVHSAPRSSLASDRSGHSPNVAVAGPLFQ